MQNCKYNLFIVAIVSSLTSTCLQCTCMYVGMASIIMYCRNIMSVLQVVKGLMKECFTILSRRKSSFHVNSRFNCSPDLHVPVVYPAL